MPRGYWKNDSRHRMWNTRCYHSWTAMLARCNKPGNNRYHLYGGRGIKVCERWHDFRLFYEDMGDPPEKMSLDRINFHGNYEPGNCRWVSQKTQQNNRSNNCRMELNGVIKTASQWSEEVGIKAQTLTARKRRGWTDERALTQPV